MDYGALTFDNQTVMTNSFDLDGKLLGLLKQFEKGPTQVVLSQVIAAEILRHLKEKTQEAKDHFENVHRRAVLFGLKDKSDKVFAESPDAEKLSRQRLERYFKDIGAKVIPPDDVPVADIMHLYERGIAPFGKKKKSEFPDAIALLSLERWAHANKTKILAVSGDPDWQKYGETSKMIDVVSDLAEALETLQEHLDRANELIGGVLTEMHAGKQAELFAQLEELTRREIPNYALYAEADSSYSLEGEQVELSLKSLELTGSGEDFRVVQVSSNKIVAEVDLLATVQADASFAVSVYDSVDKDYVDMGYVSARLEDEELEINALVTFEGDFDKGDLQISHVELIGEGGMLDFGTVEPDWGGPEEEGPQMEELEPDSEEHPLW